MTLIHPTPLWEAVQAATDAAVSRPDGTLTCITVPVPAVEPIALHAAAVGLGASLWLQPDAGFSLVGVGEAWAVRPGSGTHRFTAVSQAWAELLDGAVIDQVDTRRGTGPLLLGGFSFDDEPAGSSVWHGFEPACLVLPALLLTTTPDGCWLTLSARIGETPGLEALARMWEGLLADTDAPGADTRLATLQVVGQRPDASTWRASVARLAGAVGRGRLDKAVLARRVALEADSSIDVSAVLRRLAASAPESTVFAVSRGDRSFVGASPERLVSLNGRELRTMAMAGSAARALDSGADERLAGELEASDKEREEHAVVVAMLREVLTPVAERLDIAVRPQVVRFRHVQHLVTQVSGRLRDDADVLTLVERLHPTPAVGGMPRALALELIAEEEPIERGWYAGPLGWIDRHGDGEFVVALRSGVIHRSRVWLFAGCGIVADSDPEQEWDESSAKLLALGSALGRIEP